MEATARSTTDRTARGGPDWRWWIAIMVLGASLLVGGAMFARALPSLEQPAWGFPGFGGLFALSFGLMGGLMVRRRRGNLIGWLLLAAGVQAGLQLVADTAPQIARTVDLEGTGFDVWSSWVSNWIWAPGVATIGLLLLVFPDGEPPSARWRPVGWLLGLGTLQVVLALALTPGPLQNFPRVDNPAGIRGAPSSLLALAYMTYLGSLIACALAPIARWRGAPPVVRAQIKWLALAGLPMMITIVVSLAFVPASYLSIAFGNLVAVAVAIAVLRYRLYDIDQLISRSISWAVVSAALAATFAVVVLVLQAILAGLIQGQTLAVAASTLVAFALFQPLRRRVQAAVDRRFDRARYDAQRTVDEFAEQLRAVADMATLRLDLLATAAQAVRPVAADLWLRPVASEGQSPGR